MPAKRNRRIDVQGVQAAQKRGGAGCAAGQAGRMLRKRYNGIRNNMPALRI